MGRHKKDSETKSVEEQTNEITEVKRKSRQAKEKAIIPIHDELRISVETDCLTLEKYMGKDKQDEDVWVGKKFFGTWDGLLDYLIKAEIVENIKKREIVELKDMKEILVESTNNIKQLLLGEFKKSFKDASDEIKQAIKKYTE